MAARVGSALTAGGAVLYLISLFLPHAGSFGDEKMSVFELNALADIFLLIVTLGVAVAAVLCFLTHARGLPTVMAAGAGFLLAAVMLAPLEFLAQDIEGAGDLYGFGVVVSIIAALVMLVGALMAALGAASGRRAAPAPAAGARDPGGAAATPGQTSTGGAPAPGWYPDPTGEARLRYWSGSAWTDQRQQ